MQHQPLALVFFFCFVSSRALMLTGTCNKLCQSHAVFFVIAIIQRPSSVSSLPRHGGPVPEPGPGGEQLGPGQTQHGARDRRHPRKPHHASFLCVGRLPKVSGVPACSQQLLQEAEGSGLYRIPQAARSHLHQVFQFYLHAAGWREPTFTPCYRSCGFHFYHLSPA